MPKAKVTKPKSKTLDKSAQVVDGFSNFLSRIGVQGNNTLSAGTYLPNNVTRNRVKIENAYRGSWVVGAVIDSIAEDMTRAGIDITTSADDSEIKQIQHAISRLKLWQSTASNVKFGRLYGGSLAVIQIKGQDTGTPLDIDTVGKDQFQGLVVFDRHQLQPDLTNVIKDGPDMGLPAFYDVVTNAAKAGDAGGEFNPDASTGRIRVHHSRCIRFTGIDLPYWQAQIESMWGESILERLWDRLIAFDNVTMASASLVDRANLRTVGVMGLREIIAGGGAAQAGLVAMFDMMRQLQTSEGLTLMDKDDSFETTAYSFAGLSDMMLQFGQQLAGASGIPLVRLFGQSPAGLSSTGEADIRMYYDNINAQQEAKLRGAWDVLVKVLWRSVFGKEVPEDLEFTFTPLWQMSAADKINNTKAATETVLGALEAQTIDKATAMEELRDMSAETGIFQNITDEMIEDAKAQAAVELPPLPDSEPGTPSEPNADPSKPEPSASNPIKSLGVSAPTGDSAQLSPYQKIKRWLTE